MKALDQYEWANLRIELGNGYYASVEHEPAPGSSRGLVIGDASGGTFLDARARLQLAAIALHGGSFGFTQEDVERLHTAIDAVAPDFRAAGLVGLAELQEAELRWLVSLADRIANLLPPAP